MGLFSLFKRKSVADIVAPLNQMVAELHEAVEHHEAQIDYHVDKQVFHAGERAVAETVRRNLTKLVGGNNGTAVDLGAGSQSGV